MASSQLTGIVVLTRHGDRQGFYQSPKTYTASQTNLTVLGYRQQLYNGQDLRARYLLPDSATHIEGIDGNIAENAQIKVLADAGGEGGVIVESALALLQGLYPPYNETLALANGTTVSWDGRVQLIPVETVEPDQSVLMEPWTECEAWTSRLDKWYASSDFKDKAAAANAFYASISDILGNRPKVLENAWNIYDFLNVESIHEASLSPRITDDILRQAGEWANYHETGSFADAQRDNVGNVAGQGMLSLILDGLGAAANSSDPLKVSVLAASYKPFLSLFKMLSIPALENNLVDYASTMVFEVYDDQTLTVRFRNGSAGDFAAYPVLESTQGERGVAVSDFERQLRPHTIDTLAEWCNVCSTTEARGCAELNKLNGTGSGGRYASDTSTYGHHAVSPVVAGVIGSVVTLATVAALLGAFVFLTGSSLVFASKRSKNAPRLAGSTNFAARSRNADSIASAVSLQAETLAEDYDSLRKGSFELQQSASNGDGRA